MNVGSEDNLLEFCVPGAGSQSKAVCSKDLTSTLCAFWGVYSCRALVKLSSGWSSSSNFVHYKRNPVPWLQGHAAVWIVAWSVWRSEKSLEKDTRCSSRPKSCCRCTWWQLRKRRHFIWQVRITFWYCHARQILRDPHPWWSTLSEVSTVCRAEKTDAAKKLVKLLKETDFGVWVVVLLSKIQLFCKFTVPL